MPWTKRKARWVGGAAAGTPGDPPQDICPEAIATYIACSVAGFSAAAATAGLASPDKWAAMGWATACAVDEVGAGLGAEDWCGGDGRLGGDGWRGWW
jgi:hypothetical protein